MVPDEILIFRTNDGQLRSGESLSKATQSFFSLSTFPSFFCWAQRISIRGVTGTGTHLKRMTEQILRMMKTRNDFQTKRQIWLNKPLPDLLMSLRFRIVKTCAAERACSRKLQLSFFLQAV